MTQQVCLLKFYEPKAEYLIDTLLIEIGIFRYLDVLSATSKSGKQLNLLLTNYITLNSMSPPYIMLFLFKQYSTMRLRLLISSFT